MCILMTYRELCLSAVQVQRWWEREGSTFTYAHTYVHTVCTYVCMYNTLHTFVLEYVLRLDVLVALKCCACVYMHTYASVLHVPVECTQVVPSDTSLPPGRTAFC